MLLQNDIKKPQIR